MQCLSGVIIKGCLPSVGLSVLLQQIRTDAARFAFCSPLSFHRLLLFYLLKSHHFPSPFSIIQSASLSTSFPSHIRGEGFRVQRRRPRSAWLSVVWLSAHVFSRNDPLAPHYRKNAVTSLQSYGPFHWPRRLKRRPRPICSHPQSQNTSLGFASSVITSYCTDEGDQYTPTGHVTSFCTGQNKLKTSFITQAHTLDNVFRTWEC